MSMRQTTTQRRQQLLLFVLAVLALLISGCSSGAYWSWQHPQGLDMATLQQDKIECRAMAEQQLNRFDYYRHYDYSRFSYDRYDRRGHLRPYYPLRYYDFHRYNLDLNQLYRFCLRAKGWQLIKVAPDVQQNPE